MIAETAGEIRAETAGEIRAETAADYRFGTSDGWIALKRGDYFPANLFKIAKRI